MVRFIFRLLFLVILTDEVTKIQKYVFLHFFKSLARLSLQTETIVKKITQPKLRKTKLPKYVMNWALVSIQWHKCEIFMKNLEADLKLVSKLEDQL